MYRHLFWDMGGTLVDTYPALNATFAAVLAQHGQAVDVDEVARLTHVSTGHAIATLSARYGLPASTFEDAQVALKQRWETDPAPVMAGAGELMAAVRAAGGLNLVVTHRDRASATALLDGLGLEADDLVSTSDGFPRKPDPAMYRALVERHHLDAATCLAVGDRTIDTIAAHRAGLGTAQLVGDATEPPPPGTGQEGTADHVVDRLPELRPLLQLVP